MKKKLILITTFIIFVVFILLCYYYFENNKEKEEDKFSSEYTKVNSTNVFVYKTKDEVLKILENGTGLVFLGFPECPWCQGLAPLIDEEANSEDLSKVYYFNIKYDRSNNTEAYKKMVSILSDFLRYDDEGNKKIFAPSVIAVKDGEIVDFYDTRSWDKADYSTPEEFWSNADLTPLRTKLKEMIKLVNDDKLCKNDCD